MTVGSPPFRGDAPRARERFLLLSFYGGPPADPSSQNQERRPQTIPLNSIAVAALKDCTVGAGG